MRLTIRSGVLLVALVCGLAGCSASTSAGPPVTGETSPPPSVTTSASSSTTAEAVRGKVTTADYEAAVRKLDGCLTKAGLQLINDGWDPVDNEQMLLRYKAPGMSFERGDKLYEECAATNLKPVADKYYQDNGSHMEPALMAAVQACVRRQGITLTGREQDPADLLAAVPEKKQQILRDCVRTSVTKIYPNLFATNFP
jgi:hypothetical protein